MAKITEADRFIWELTPDKGVDVEIIKDIIMEQNPTTTRSNIIFDNIYMSYNGESIMCPYRELVWSQQFSVTRLDYLNRYKEKQRMNKLNELI